MRPVPRRDRANAGFGRASRGGGRHGCPLGRRLFHRLACLSRLVSAKTGLLEKMSIAGVDVITKMDISVSAGPPAKIELVQEGPSKLVAYISAGGDKAGRKIIDKALRLSYEAQDDSTLLVKVLANVGGIVGGSGPRFTLGNDAQMVRSLEFRETIPMPAHPIPQPVAASEVLLCQWGHAGHSEPGAGNPLNPNENGGVSGMTYGRSGYVPHSEYVYTLIAERGGRPALGAPAMTVVEAATPAVFWQGEPIAATLKLKKEHCRKLAGLAGLRIKYEVEDAFEKVVGKGETPLDSFRRRRPHRDQSRPAYPQARLVPGVLHSQRRQEQPPGRPRAVDLLGAQAPGQHGRIVRQRHSDRLHARPWTGARQHESGQRGRGAAGRGAKREKRPGTDVNVSYQIDGSPVGNDPKRFGEVCYKLFERVKDSIPRIEIINEPNGTLQPKEYIETFLRPAYENIHRASPGTKVLGPVLCGIGPEQARYLEDLYKLGLKGLTDELTFHPYAGNFDDGEAVSSMQRLSAVIATNSDSNKPVHFTEAGYGHGGWSNLPWLREIVKLAVSQYAWQNAVLGIDHRHNFYYFTDTMGYYDMWLRATQLTPAAVALRTYTGFVKGLGRAKRWISARSKWCGHSAIRGPTGKSFCYGPRPTTCPRASRPDDARHADHRRRHSRALRLFRQPAAGCGKPGQDQPRCRLLPDVSGGCGQGEVGAGAGGAGA